MAYQTQKKVGNAAVVALDRRLAKAGAATNWVVPGMSDSLRSEVLRKTRKTHQLMLWSLLQSMLQRVRVVYRHRTCREAGVVEEAEDRSDP